MCADAIYPPYRPELARFELEPEVECAAVDRGQAMRVFGDAKKIAQASPNIARRLVIPRLDAPDLDALAEPADDSVRPGGVENVWELVRTLALEVVQVPSAGQDLILAAHLPQLPRHTIWANAPS